MTWSTPNPQSFEFVRKYSAEPYRARWKKAGFRTEKKYLAEIGTVDGTRRPTDVADFMIGSSPGGLVRQERRGYD